METARAAVRRQPAFAVEEYRARLKTVQSALAAQHLDCLLATGMPSICYLTGFETFATHKYSLVLVPVSGDPILLVQDFESYNARWSSWLETVDTYAIGGDPIAATRRLLESRRFIGKRVGIEMGVLSSIGAREYLHLQAILSDTVLIDATELVPYIAVVKSPVEVAKLREVAQITSAGMSVAAATVAEGRVDSDVAAAAYDALVRKGSEYFCYQPIVTVGARSGIPHSTFHRVPIQSGDTVFVELGACVDRYSSPLMRTMVVGPPSDEVRRMYDLCQASVNSVIERLKPGLVAGEVADDVERAVGPIPKDWIWHGCYGYSVGLGFPPEWCDCFNVAVSKGNKEVLKPGMVFHCSTSIRNPGVVGTTCSETVLVTERGCEVLTSLTRTLFVK